MPAHIIRRARVCTLTGLSESSILRLERRGEFPRRRRLGPNSVGYVLAEVEEWLCSRPLVVVDCDAPDSYGSGA